MLANIGSKFKVPDYQVGEEVIFFSPLSGCFAKGVISQIQTYTDDNQNVINYTIMLNETKGVPNVPEAIVFDSYKDANKWLSDIQLKLLKE